MNFGQFGLSIWQHYHLLCQVLIYLLLFLKFPKKKRISIVQLSFKFQCAVLDSVKYVTSFLFNIFSVYLLWQTESYNDTSIPKGGNYFIYWKSQCAQMKYIHTYIYDFAGLFFTLTITLRSLLSVLFYQTTLSEFFQKVSIKRKGPSQKKSIVLFYFRAATANFWSLLNDLVWIFKKVSIKWPVLTFFKF